MDTTTTRPIIQLLEQEGFPSIGEDVRLAETEEAERLAVREAWGYITSGRRYDDAIADYAYETLAEFAGVEQDA